MSGKGRGVLRDFRMARVGIQARMASCQALQTRLLGRILTDSCLQFQFRLNALEGNIPGVKKASW